MTVCWCKEELKAWEQKLDEKNMGRMFQPQKTHRNPRREALMDYRHHRLTGWCYGTESKYVRKLTARGFRRRMKSRIHDEVFYRPVPHDYKTYGWLTW